MPQDYSSRSRKHSVLRAWHLVDYYYHYVKSVSLGEEALTEQEAGEVLQRVAIVEL